jgi:hypothetical protein
MENPEETTPQPEGAPTVETHYDEGTTSTGTAWNCNPAEALCSVAGEIRDTVLKALPLGVTEHLVSGEKEIVKAGIALAESHLRAVEEVLQRARDIKK